MAEHSQYDNRHLNLLYNHASCSITINIPLLILRHHNGDLFAQGSGRIESSPDDKILIIIESGGFNFLKLPGFIGKRSRGYILDEEKLTAEGELENGLYFKTSALDVRSIGNMEQVLNPQSIEFTSESTTDQRQYSRLTLITRKGGFIDPNIDLYKNSVNEFRQNIPHSFAEIDLPTGKYEVRGKDNASYIRTEVCLSSPEDQERFESSLLLAISFCIGKKILSRGFYESGSVHRTVLDRRTSQEAYTYFTPLTLGVTKETVYEMYSCLQHFFFQLENSPIIDLLEIFLLPRERMEYLSRTLVVAALVEGLVGLLYDRITEKQEDNEFINARDKIIAFLQQGTLEGVSIEQQNRFANILSSQEALNFPRMLDSVANYYKVPVERIEKKTYKEVRNKLAHGRFGNPYDISLSQLQDQADNLAYLTNLFNKLLLSAANYKGVYWDYSIPGGRLSNLGEQSTHLSIQKQ